MLLLVILIISISGSMVIANSINDYRRNNKLEPITVKFLKLRFFKIRKTKKHKHYQLKIQKL